MAMSLAPVWRTVKERVLRVGSKEQQDFLKAAADMGSERLDLYGRYEDYYDGEHRVQLAEREREYLEASGFRYAENFCETIVDAETDRLKVTGFDSDQEKLRDFAHDLWDVNRMDAAQVEVHEGAVKLGDYFVIVEAEDGRLPYIAANHPSGVKAVYDSGEMVYAVKVWNTNRFSASNPDGQQIRRMNIYWPDAIQKFFCPSKSEDLWAAFHQDDDDKPTMPWTMDGTPGGEPIGIPVIHFANKPNKKCYGRSELRGVIPQQDALNKSLIDHFWIMDAQGWPQQWGSGVKADAVERHPGSLWTTESEEARFGQLDPADPEKSIQSIESQITRMASRSKTPLHLMLAGGQLPSGETLKTSESGFTRKIGRFQTFGGNRWEDTIRMAARVANAFDSGQDDPPLEGKLSARWERAESRQELDEANTAVLWKALGVSNDTILSRLGFDPAEERKKREQDPDPLIADELLEKARQMQRSEAVPQGTGGDQPKKGQPGRNAARTR